MAILQVPITKGKASVQVDTDAIPEAVFAEALLQGLKVLLNRGMSKITKETYPDAEELKVAAMEQAEKNVIAVNEGKIKFSGAKTSKVSGVVKTEAMRIARNLVKDAIKAAGGKVSHVDASEITKAAKALMEEEPSILEQAAANLAERAKVPVKINVSAIPVSAAKVKAAEAKKAKDQLSAKQAGKVATRKKGQPQATAH